MRDPEFIGGALDMDIFDRLDSSADLANPQYEERIKKNEFIPNDDRLPPTSRSDRER